MVKKKGKSKRSTLKDKYKIKRRVLETNRKRKKQTKRDAKNGVVRHDHKSNKDPGIPNSWPFKQDLLKDIQRSREKQQQKQEELKTRRKEELRQLKEHQESGGTARTIEELMQTANAAQQKFAAKQTDGEDEQNERSDGAVAAGQQSRRAYLRELKKVVDTADVLLQVLDARDPVSSRIHSSLEDVILSKHDKRMVLVLNKIDLVPKDVVGRWLTVLRRAHPAVAIKANTDRSDTKEDATKSNAPVGTEAVLQLLKNYARTSDGKMKTTIVVGVIGYPNVGKSSIINAFKRSRAVGVSPRPGFTTSMQEVVLDKNIRLLDSPGVVFDDKSALLGNCIDAESVEDPIPAVDALLKRCNAQSLIMTYNIPAFAPGDTMMFLAMVARKYGRVLKGGIPDKIAAARAVLKDWNSGKIPFYTVPPAESHAQADSAKVVSSFGAEFDLSKYDEEVMQSLEDSDEMDFVQVTESSTSATASTSRHIQSAAKYFAGGSDDDDDDDDSSAAMDDEDDDDSLAAAREKLAEAEDYDFEAM